MFEEGESASQLFVDLLRKYSFNYANTEKKDIRDMKRDSKFSLKDKALDGAMAAANAASNTRNSNFLGSTYDSPNLNPLLSSGNSDFEAGGYGFGTNVITNFFAFFVHFLQK